MPRVNILRSGPGDKIDRMHQQHVRKIKKPARGSLAVAEGHSLRMVVTTSFECECGLKLERKQKTRRGELTLGQRAEIKDLYDNTEHTVASLAKKFKVSRSLIGRIVELYP